jgi:predicted DNA-binding transcriptional regulator YafY
VPRAQLEEDLFSTLLLCGVPPYFPHDYICVSLEGDRVQVMFAERFSRPVSLDAMEALALKLACESTAHGPQGARAVTQLMRRVEEGMAPRPRKLFKALSRRVGRDPEQPPTNAIPYDRVCRAGFEQRWIEIEHYSGGSNAPEVFEIDPYGGITRNGVWYLVGRLEGETEPRFFRGDRIRNLKVLDRKVGPRARVDLDALAARPFVANLGLPQASIICRGLTARWIAESAEPDTLKLNTDGSVHWTPPVANEEALARILLGHGGDCEVIAPESLKQQYFRMLKSVVAAHA